jgi:excisionase family DNA binding protein
MAWDDLAVEVEPSRPIEIKGVEEMFTIKEVSALTKMGQSTIYQMTQRGVLPFKKIGGAIRFTSQTVRELTT